MENESVESEQVPSFYPPSPRWGDNTKLLVVAMLFVLALLGIYLIRNVLAIAAFAGLIAFLIAPLIRLSVHRLKVPRGLALLVAYLVVFMGTLAFGALLVNSIAASIAELDPIGLVDDARVWLLAEVDDQGHILIFGLTVDISAFLDSLQTSISDSDGQGGMVLDAERLLDYLGAGFSGIRTAVGIITAAVTSAIITALVAMYLNADSQRMHESAIEHSNRRECGAAISMGSS